jgi:hypothetical protein
LEEILEKVIELEDAAIESLPFIPISRDSNAEIDNRWRKFQESLKESGLRIRVDIDKLVRERRARSTNMTSDERAAYLNWKQTHISEVI